jgi:hypothetical protein
MAGQRIMGIGQIGKGESHFGLLTGMDAIDFTKGAEPPKVKSSHTTSAGFPPPSRQSRPFAPVTASASPRVAEWVVENVGAPGFGAALPGCRLALSGFNLMLRASRAIA